LYVAYPVPGFIKICRDIISLVGGL